MWLDTTYTHEHNWSPSDTLYIAIDQDTLRVVYNGTTSKNNIHFPQTMTIQPRMNIARNRLLIDNLRSRFSTLQILTINGRVIYSQDIVGKEFVSIPLKNAQQMGIVRVTGKNNDCVTRCIPFP